MSMARKVKRRKNKRRSTHGHSLEVSVSDLSDVNPVS
jgi:hypothetical protein